MKQKSKKEWKAEDFLTRAERMKLMKIPSSTPERVIVRSNNEALGFKFNCYSPDILAGLVEKEKFNETVKACQKICERVWRMKKSEEGAEYNRNFKYLLLFSVFISLLAFLLLILDIYGGEDSLAYPSIALLTIAAVITILVVILSLFSEPKFIDLESEIIGCLRGYLESENSNFYRGRGMEWTVQDNFYWLELGISGKNRGDIVITTTEDKDEAAELIN